VPKVSFSFLNISEHIVRQEQRRKFGTVKNKQEKIAEDGMIAN
jgi:hypothetical protein